MTPSVLVMGDDPTLTEEWAGWLEDEGFLTVGCPGPHVRERCPRLDGERCVLREVVDVAVAGVSSRSAQEWFGWRPERHCTRLPDDGRTVLVDGRGAEISFHGEPLWIRTRIDRHVLLSLVDYVRRRGHRTPVLAGSN
jgi:hypothetical protein